MADGMALTVTTLVVKQPEGVVYVIVAVPGVPPVYTPVVTLMDAVVGEEELQVPPGVAEVKAAELVWQTEYVPVIGNGSGLTVTVTTEIHPLGGV
jgi:hypothetical protein